MEALLHQSKGVCPFLKKTSPATLRSLSTSTHQSPGGGTITNLQFIARRCPVMNKALAVQSARLNTRRSYGTAAGTGVVKSLLEKKLHTSAEKKASVDTNMFRPAQQGIFPPTRLLSFPVLTLEFKLHRPRRSNPLSRNQIPMLAQNPLRRLPHASTMKASTRTSSTRSTRTNPTAISTTSIDWRRSSLVLIWPRKKSE